VKNQTEAVTIVQWVSELGRPPPGVLPRAECKKKKQPTLAPFRERGECKGGTFTEKKKKDHEISHQPEERGGEEESQNAMLGDTAPGGGEQGKKNQSSVMRGAHRKYRETRRIIMAPLGEEALALAHYAESVAEKEKKFCPRRAAHGLVGRKRGKATQKPKEGPIKTTFAPWRRGSRRRDPNGGG